MATARFVRRALCGGGLAAVATAATLDRPRVALAEPTKSTYLVTGCNSGIGLELVRQLAARGDKVYATCRGTVGDLRNVVGDVTIVPGIDVSQDDVGDKLKMALKGVSLDVIVHNAGSFGTSSRNEQKLETVTTEIMRSTFELNTLGPLRVTQALLPQMASSGGKIAIISTMIGSITDNTSGGLYAYRTTKAAVNMMSKSMAMDLKGRGLAVVSISPGFLATNFGAMGGPDQMAKFGAKPVEKGVRGILEAIDALTLESTGKFVHGNYGDGLQPAPW